MFYSTNQSYYWKLNQSEVAIYGRSSSQIVRRGVSSFTSASEQYIRWQNHLDLEHISHEELSQNHTTTFAKTLFTNDDSQAAVLDGTCIYSEKLELQVPKEII